MKILVVQLLRLGDIVLSSPVIQGLRDQHPDAEIDLLINKQFENVVGLLPKVNHCFTFDRELIQSALGEKDRFIFEGFDRVNQLLEKLKNRKYDRIINLTHNRLSAYLVGGIECGERVGLWVDDQNCTLIESAWFKHLDTDNIVDKNQCFHFVDIYKFAAQINRPRLGIRLHESLCGKRFADKHYSDFHSKHHVVVQALTSDPKKNWGIEKFKTVISEIHMVLPEAHFTILSAPFESAALIGAFEGACYCKVVVCDLEVAYSLVVGADLVITGDTSIKHIASATDTPILELSLGSSDFRRTGAYSEKAIIIQSEESCAPCAHRSPCHRDDHFCSKTISPELVSLVALNLLRNEGVQLKNIADEFADQAKIYRVDITTTGTWMPIDVLTSLKSTQVAGLFTKFAAKLFIQHSSREKNVFEAFGSESRAFAELLESTFGRSIMIKNLLSQLERQFSLVESQLKSIENRFYQTRLTDHDSERSKIFLLELKTLNAGSMVDRLIHDTVPTFVRLRNIQLLLNDMKLKSEIELKLVRSLQICMEASVVS